MNKLKPGILTIGSQMVKCKSKCSDILNLPESGIIPRSLFLEEENRDKGKGCVMVGINPGPCKFDSEESDYYIKNGMEYSSVVGYFNDYGRDYKYYRHLRDFINCMGYTGPILWTELVKCQCKDGVKYPDLNTYRTCVGNYLSKEIDLVPDDWSIIGTGREPFNVLKYMFLRKSILGIPHPNSWGNFPNMFKGKKRKHFKKKIQDQVDTFKRSNNIAMWLVS